MSQPVSREPTHWMNASRLGGLPSLGRRTCPPVGPEAESSRSNCTLVSTLGAKPKPNSPRRVASNASNPGVSTTLPTSSSSVSSGCS